MIVYCNPMFSPDLWEKNVYAAEFMSGMIYHFQNRNFGNGLIEVVYIAISGDSVYLLSFGPGMSYSRRHKNIGSGFIMDYETIQSLEGEPLLTYLAEQVILDSKKFVEKNIKNFDLDEYIKALEEYFDEALRLMRDGKNPAEGKVLNDEVQLAMAKKWSRL